MTHPAPLKKKKKFELIDILLNKGSSIHLNA